MIIAEQDRDVVTFNAGKTTSFKIVASAHAFGTLSKNYINKEQAVIREISCNAVDAHIAAGITDPIQVHLPTSMERWFSVRDYGKGLSEDEMREVFTTYFHSTKTDSNDFIGGLGLGTKSPFCLDGVENFAVVSIHDGTRKTYSCYIGENGCPQISLLSSSATDERSGIEVTINTGYNYYTFEREAIRVFKFFSFPVDLNIQRVHDEIAKYKDSFIFENDDFVLVNSDYPQFFALMGGVAYQIQTSELIKHYNNSSVYHLSGFMKFNIGDLSFDIGRENLLMDNKTKAAIQEKFLKVVDGIKKYVAEQVESQPTLHKKCLMFNKLSKTNMFSSFAQDLDDRPEMPTMDDSILVIEKGSKRGKVVLSENKYYQIPLKIKDNSVCHVIQRKGSMSRIKDFFRGSEYDTCVVIKPEQVEESMIDEEFLIDSADFSQKQKVKPLKFDCYEVRCFTSSVALDKVTIDDDSEERIYVKVSNRIVYLDHLGKRQICNAVNNFGEYFNGKKIYALTDKFCKSKTFAKYKWVKLTDYLEKSLSKELNREYHSFNANEYMLQFLVKNFADVQEFENMRKAYNEYLQNLDMYYNLVNAGFRPKIKTDSLSEMFAKVIDKYPMLGIIDASAVQSNKSYIATVRKYINDNKD